MLLDPATLGARLAHRRRAAGPVAGASPTAPAPETHGSALELASRPHRSAGAAAGELRGPARAAGRRPRGARPARRGGRAPIRSRSGRTSRSRPASATSPSTRRCASSPAASRPSRCTCTSPCPTPEAAIDALRGPARAPPRCCSGLSANSPVLAGARHGPRLRPHAGLQHVPADGDPAARSPRYAEYVEAIDVLLRCDAIPEPTYLWWDARLQPRFGTLEVRVMDAQTRAPDTAALAALVQCVVRLEATERWASRAQSHAWEALDENRFIAARDGMAGGADRRRRRSPPAGRGLPRRAARRVRAARARARLRGGAGAGAGHRGAAGPRAPAAPREGGARRAGAELGPLVQALAGEFTAPRPEPAVAGRA